MISAVVARTPEFLLGDTLEEAYRPAFKNVIKQLSMDASLEVGAVEETVSDLLVAKLDKHHESWQLLRQVLVSEVELERARLDTARQTVKAVKSEKNAALYAQKVKTFAQKTRRTVDCGAEKMRFSEVESRRVAKTAARLRVL